MALIAPDLHVAWKAIAGISQYEYEIKSGGIVLRTGTVFTNSLIYTYKNATADGVQPNIDIFIRAYDSATGGFGNWFSIAVAAPFSEIFIPSVSGATGAFTTADGKTVSVVNGLIDSIA